MNILEIPDAVQYCTKYWRGWLDDLITSTVLGVKRKYANFDNVVLADIAKHIKIDVKIMA